MALTRSHMILSPGSGGTEECPISTVYLEYTAKSADWRKLSWNVGPQRKRPPASWWPFAFRLRLLPNKRRVNLG